MTKAYDRIKEGLEEALSIAKGEMPAASITVNGHVYVPKAELDEVLRRYEKLKEKKKRVQADNQKLMAIANGELSTDMAEYENITVSELAARLRQINRGGYLSKCRYTAANKLEELQSELAGCKIALEQAWESNRERQAENERLRKSLDEWIAAAEATDIYEWLQDALRRMGTVGPKGIRQMIAYCDGLKQENERLVRNAQTEEWLLAGYHRICERHGIAPSSAELIAAAKEVESEQNVGT